MKTFRLIAVSLMFAAVFAVSAFAQTPTAAVSKIGFIDTGAFGEEKTGITKFNVAVTALGNEVKPMYAEVQKMIDDYQKLDTDIKTMKEQYNKNPNGPIAVKSITDKEEQLQLMQLNIKRKKEDADAKSAKRQAEKLGPINEEIGKALQEYATKNGYSVILDASQLYKAGVMLVWDPKADITDDFIKFFNTKPATGGATATK